MDLRKRRSDVFSSLFEKEKSNGDIKNRSSLASNTGYNTWRPFRGRVLSQSSYITTVVLLVQVRTWSQLLSRLQGRTPKHMGLWVKGGRCRVELAVCWSWSWGIFWDYWDVVEVFTEQQRRRKVFFMYIIFWSVMLWCWHWLSSHRHLSNHCPPPQIWNTQTHTICRGFERSKSEYMHKHTDTNINLKAKHMEEMLMISGM